MFEIFGVGGEIPPELNRNLLELNNTRNLIVHHRSKVDQKFLKNCPWLRDLKINQIFNVDDKKWNLYYSSVRKYIHNLMLRLEKHYGVN